MATVDTLKIDVVLNGKKADAWVKRFDKSLKGIQKTAKKNNDIFKSFLKLAGFAGFVKATHDAMELGHSLEMLSKRTGVASSNLSQMRNALKGAGGDAKEMDRVLANISKGLSRTFMGEGKLNSALSMFGVSGFVAGTRKQRDARDILIDLAESASKKVRSGVSTYGEMITILEDTFAIPQELADEMLKGGNAFREFLESAPKITDETSAALDRMEKSWNEMTVSMSNSFNNYLAKFEEPLTRAMNVTKRAFDEHGNVIWTGVGAVGTASAVSGGSAMLGGAGALGTVVAAAKGGIYGIVAFLAGLGAYNAFGELGGSFSDLASGREFWSGKESAARSLQMKKEAALAQLGRGASRENVLWTLKKMGADKDLLLNTLIEGYKSDEYDYAKMASIAKEIGLDSGYYGKVISRMRPTYIDEENANRRAAGLPEMIDVEAYMRERFGEGGEVNINIENNINGSSNPQETGEIVSMRTEESVLSALHKYSIVSGGEAFA